LFQTAPHPEAKSVENAHGFRQIGVVKRVNFLTLLLAAAWFAGCAKSSPPAPAPAAAVPASAALSHAQPRLRTMKLYLGPEVFDAELALSDQEVQTGMMFRTNILETDAMLFDLRFPQQAGFWMENCPESISVAYITADGTIQEVHHLEKYDTNTVFAARNDIVFALETREGWFARHNIAPGTVITTEKGSLADVFLRRQ
jgi:uncharacterized protein